MKGSYSTPRSSTALALVTDILYRMPISDEGSRLFASLAAIRGFVTRSELEHSSLTPHKPLPNDPFERLAERSGDRSLDDGAGSALGRLLMLRVEVASRCMVGLSEALLQKVAHDAVVPAERLVQLQMRMAAALQRPADALAAEFVAIGETEDIAGLVGSLRQSGVWPGDPASPHVREYLGALADAVAQHSRLAFWAAGRWIQNPPRLVLLLALDGLAEGIERFDEKRGTRLTTYATSWIRQRVQRGYWSSIASIRQPVHLQEKLVKIRRMALFSVVQEGRSLPLTELMQRLTDEAPLPLEMAELLTTPRDVWDIRRSDGESEFDHLFADKHITPAHTELRRHLTQLVQDVTFKNDRAREILARRYPLNARVAGETLEAIGEAFGLTRERIRQIESSALDILARALSSRLAGLRRGRGAEHEPA